MLDREERARLKLKVEANSDWEGPLDILECEDLIEELERQGTEIIRLEGLLRDAYEPTDEVTHRPTRPVREYG